MTNSGAWKPFAWLLFGFLVWFGFKVHDLAKPADTAITTNDPNLVVTFNAGSVGAVVIVAVLVLFVIAAMARSSHKDSRYVHPTARKLRTGEIEVTGDVEYIQRNFNMVTSISEWTKVGDRRWRVDMPTVNDEETDYIVKAINISKNT